MFLYHATFKSRLESIKARGLGRMQLKNWSFSESGCVYLCSDKGCAISYCEAAEEVPEDVYASGIVVLKIDMTKIDKNRLSLDHNQKEQTMYRNYKYKGIISFTDLAVCT